MARCSGLVWSSGLPGRTPSWAASTPSVEIGAAARASEGVAAAARPARSVRRSRGMAALRARHHSAGACARAEFLASRLTAGDRGKDRFAHAYERIQGESHALGAGAAARPRSNAGNMNEYDAARSPGRGGGFQRAPIDVVAEVAAGVAREAGLDARPARRRKQPRERRPPAHARAGAG